MPNEATPTLAHRWAWRATLFEAACLLAAARFMIVFLPFRLWRDSLGVIEGGTSPGNTSPSWDALPESQRQRYSHAGWMARAVARIAPILPFRAVCLPQAVALRWMLARRGYQNLEVHYGAGFSDQHEAELHAWLTLDGYTLIGGHDGRFTPLARHYKRPAGMS